MLLSILNVVDGVSQQFTLRCPERSARKVTSSHDEMYFDMRSDGEAEEWAKVIPFGAGTLVHEWQDYLLVLKGPKGGELHFKMQGPQERDSWMRAFPDPMPRYCELAYNFGGRSLMVGPREKPETKQPSLAAGAGDGVTASASPAAAADPTRPVVAPPPPPTIEEMIKTLESYSEAQLITQGAELGLRFNKKKDTKALMAGAIVEERERRKAAQQMASAETSAAA